jgi:hypothetical protein
MPKFFNISSYPLCHAELNSASPLSKALATSVYEILAFARITSETAQHLKQIQGDRKSRIHL